MKPPGNVWLMEPKRQMSQHVEAGKKVRFQVDLSRPDELKVITVDERDDLYPFGRQPTANSPTKEENPVTTSTPHPGMVNILQDLAKGKVGNGSWVSATDKGVKDVVAQALRLKQRREELFGLVEQARLSRQTAGLEFWKGEFRELLIESLKAEFDDVLREVLPEMTTIDPDKPPAPIRFAESWDGQAPYSRARKLAPAEAEECRAQLQELLELGVIRPSASPFGSPVMMVPKPGAPGKMRMVVDFRALNDITIADKFPLPDVQGIMDALHNKKIFTTFDLLSGFWQVPVYPPHVERTAMTTQFGQFEWVFMPMGLKNSPSVFQRNMNAITARLPNVHVFVDDIIIGSNSVEEHVKDVRTVLDMLRQHKLTVKGSKA
jgi:hypothetical protein